ncbi:MAG: inositol monophosphatase [Streptosporangiales bacterium]|nr:inositol monophosphatase [Streptosporangiales bacterium]
MVTDFLHAATSGSTLRSMHELSSSLTEVALDAAAAGERAIQEAVGTPLEVSTKASPRDLVTAADHAAERAIIAYLREQRPDDAILAEESGEHPGTSPVRWVIDPLDGTTNFVHGRPDFAVAVAAEMDEEYVTGAIRRPAFGDWIAGGEVGIWASEGSPGVSEPRRLDDALISVGISLLPERRATSFALLGELLPAVRDFRRTGSASCDLFAVATGALDAYVTLDVRPWDIGPGWAVARAAGGRCLRIPTVAGRSAFLVGNPTVVDQLLPLVESHDG